MTTEKQNAAMLLDLVLSDPDTQLSDGARRSLMYLRSRLTSASATSQQEPCETCGGGGYISDHGEARDCPRCNTAPPVQQAERSGYVCADCRAPLRAGNTCDACGSDAADDDPDEQQALKDAERLDWLAAECENVTRTDIDTWSVNGGAELSLRDAIDAAIAATKKD